MSLFSNIIKSVHAADTIDVGGIKGIGPFGFENEAVSAGSTQTQLSSILTTVVTAITVVGGLALLIFLVLGGLNWLTAGGDKGKVETAQKTISNAVIGITIMVVSLLVVDLIGNILGIDILNPFTTLFGGSAT